MQRTYLAIDLKSYYASAECAARHLDPMTTNLVVADASRTEKTICLAVSPSLKAYGIPGRARLFEVVQKLKEVNAGRPQNAIRNKTAVYRDGKACLSAPSYDATALAADSSLEVSYLVAPPRMAYYEKVSRQIYGIYLKYIAPEDIVVYSIDEVFTDVTAYLSHYKRSAHDLAMTMIREVLYTTGITATAGIGTNLYLAKLAMDITAKHAAPDKDGVRIAELDEESFRYLLWGHMPMTDFWQTGLGTVRRLARLGIHTMGELARASLQYQEMLYKEFGIDAEILIDHAWGLEPCGMKEINAYNEEKIKLSDKLLQVKKGTKITVRYFFHVNENTGRYETISGTVVKLDTVFCELKILPKNAQKSVGFEKELATIIPFKDICEIAGEGIASTEDYLGSEKYPDDI